MESGSRTTSNKNRVNFRALYLSDKLKEFEIHPLTFLVYPYFPVITWLREVTTIRIFIKSPEEGRLDCPKYRENQLARLFFFAVFFIIV